MILKKSLHKYSLRVPLDLQFLLKCANGMAIFFYYPLFTAYEHFQRTFATINISGLRQEETIHLCKSFLEEDIGYHLTIPFLDELDPDEHGLREPLHVRLVMRDTEILPQDRISSRQCPPVLENPYKYFVSSSTKPNALVMYVQYDHEEYYSVPEAFIDKINKRILTDQTVSVTRTISSRP